MTIHPLLSSQKTCRIFDCSGRRPLESVFKVSSQSRKFEFNVFSVIHLKMAITFDVLDRFQENKVLQTAQIMNNIPRSSKKLQLCHQGNRDLFN